MKLISNILNCNRRPILNESCPCSFSMDLWIVHPTIIKVSIVLLNCFSYFSFHLHYLIVSTTALAIAFDHIMFKYYLKLTTCNMLLSTNGSFLLVCLVGKCGNVKTLWKDMESCVEFGGFWSFISFSTKGFYRLTTSVGMINSLVTNVIIGLWGIST